MIRRECEVKPIFAVTLGDAVAAGADLLRPAIAAAFNKHSYVHGLGDGATWIQDQMERQFATQGRYHVDFFHVCDYWAVAKACAADDRDWMSQKKDCLKTDRLPAVLKALAPFLEPDTVPSDEAPVRGSYRCLTHRPGPFEYQAAIQAALPVGSGEVESAHCYVIQKRVNYLVQGRSYKMHKRCSTSVSPVQMPAGINIGTRLPLELCSTLTFDHTQSTSTRKGIEPTKRPLLSLRPALGARRIACRSIFGRLHQSLLRWVGLSWLPCLSPVAARWYCTTTIIYEKMSKSP
jgi:hypothetical protein